MRLKEKERLFIKEIAKRYFGGEAKVYLFGSRLSDDNIDLYIETDSKDYVLIKN